MVESAPTNPESHNETLRNMFWSIRTRVNRFPPYWSVTAHSSKEPAAGSPRGRLGSSPAGLPIAKLTRPCMLMNVGPINHTG
jgi:hypothetical protein